MSSTYKITIERDGEVLECREITLHDNEETVTMKFSHVEQKDSYRFPDETPIINREIEVTAYFISL